MPFVRVTHQHREIHEDLELPKDRKVEEVTRLNVTFKSTVIYLSHLFTISAFIILYHSKAESLNMIGRFLNSFYIT